MNDISDKDTGTGTEPEAERQQPEPLAWEEQKRQAQSAWNSEITKEFERQIREYGEIRQYGLPWYMRPEFEPDTHEDEPDNQEPKG